MVGCLCLGERSIFGVQLLRRLTIGLKLDQMQRNRVARVGFVDAIVLFNAFIE